MKFSLRQLFTGVTLAAIAAGLVQAIWLGAPREVVYTWWSLAGIAVAILMVRMATREPSIVAAGLLLLLATASIFVAVLPWFNILTGNR